MHRDVVAVEGDLEQKAEAAVPISEEDRLKAALENVTQVLHQRTPPSEEQLQQVIKDRKSAMDARKAISATDQPGRRAKANLVVAQVQSAVSQLHLKRHNYKEAIAAANGVKRAADAITMAHPASPRTLQEQVLTEVVVVRRALASTDDEVQRPEVAGFFVKVAEDALAKVSPVLHQEAVPSEEQFQQLIKDRKEAMNAVKAISAIDHPVHRARANLAVAQVQNAAAQLHLKKGHYVEAVAAAKGVRKAAAAITEAHPASPRELQKQVVAEVVAIGRALVEAVDDKHRPEAEIFVKEAEDKKAMLFEETKRDEILGGIEDAIASNPGVKIDLEEQAVNAAAKLKADAKPEVDMRADLSSSDSSGSDEEDNGHDGGGDADEQDEQEALEKLAGKLADDAIDDAIGDAEKELQTEFLREQEAERVTKAEVVGRAVEGDAVETKVADAPASGQPQPAATEPEFKVPDDLKGKEALIVEKMEVLRGLRQNYDKYLAAIRDALPGVDIQLPDVANDGEKAKACLDAIKRCADDMEGVGDPDKREAIKLFATVEAVMAKVDCAQKARGFGEVTLDSLREAHDGLAAGLRKLGKEPTAHAVDALLKEVSHRREWVRDITWGLDHNQADKFSLADNLLDMKIHLREMKADALTREFAKADDASVEDCENLLERVVKFCEEMKPKRATVGRQSKVAHQLLRLKQSIETEVAQKKAGRDQPRP